MKIKDFVNVTKNSANNQISFVLKARDIKKNNITPEQILNIKVPLKSSVKNLLKIKKEVINNGKRKTSDIESFKHIK